MRKIAQTFYFIILMLICQPLSLVAYAEAPKTDENTMTLSEAQKTAIMQNCSKIKDALQKVQKDDSRARVYLGGYYEIILSKFIIPLNVRLVENNLSTAGLVENQNKLAEAKSDFVNDFVTYQKDLETLTTTDCKSEPDKFYTELLSARKKRQNVADEVKKMRSLVTNNIKLVQDLKEKAK